ncbi:MAG: type I restriction-modification system subunit M [Candidatus Omnitrophica bacterium]|nr:type I restriction-modification system subunit M [Candidatus Omnitrophota bacterium]
MKGKELDFEDKLWKGADKLRKKIEVHEYKYVVLGLIFLKYLSFAFEEKKIKILKEKSSSEKFIEKICEDKDVYLANGTLYVPEKARWEYIKKNANQPNIGEIIDKAIEILEEEYPRQLKDIIPKIYSKVNLDPYDLSYLINLFSEIEFDDDHFGKDIFGRIYEYFLGKFTEAEGRKGGEFYTPRSLTKLIVEILDVKEGRIFDPACGSGGFFVSALEKLEKEEIEKERLSIYGQESKEFVWKMCKMNLVIRGTEGDIRWGDSYHDDKFFDLRAEYVVSNPPFNDSGWGRDRIKENDPRFKYGLPPENNANYVWIQHYIYHLAPNGKAGFVMANGALSVGGIEGEIRKKIIEDDLVYGIIATPPKMFYTVSLPASLWFLRKSKPEHMRGKILFIYAKKLFKPISRRQNIFVEEHIKKIVEKFRMFEKGENEEKINEVGFSKVASLEEVAKNGYVLTPGRYVGVKLEEEDIPFEEAMKNYSEELSKLLEEEEKLKEKIKEVFKALGWEI